LLLNVNKASGQAQNKSEVWGFHLIQGFAENSVEIQSCGILHASFLKGQNVKQ